MSFVTIKIRRATTAQWNVSTKVLSIGELGLDTTLNKLKVGNGSSLWSALPYLNVLPSEFTELAQDAVESALTAGTGITKVYNDAANTITLAVDNTIANKTYVDDSISALGNTSTNTFVPQSDVGQIDGVASLDSQGYVPQAQLTNTITQLQTYADTKVSGLVNSAPATLDTLKELSDALGADANFAATTATALGTKITATSQDTLKNKNISISNGITSVSQYDTVSGFYGQNNIPVIQSPGSGATINISNTGVISVATSGIGYTSGIAIIGGGTRILIEIGGNTLTGTLAQFNASLTDADFATQAAVDSKLAILEPAIDIYITNSEMSGYLVNGVLNGTINFKKGKKYRIIVNASGHPFWIQTVNGAYSAGSLYSTGITNAGTDNGSILVELPQSAPDNLYYVCQYHSSMRGSINSYLVDVVEYATSSAATTYTISSSNSGRMTEFTSGTDVTITIPTDPTNVTWPIGSNLELRQMGAGRLIFSVTSPATIVSTDGYLKTRTQYSSAFLEKRASNAWILTGDIDA
jgi:hypothetical protein